MSISPIKDSNGNSNIPEKKASIDMPDGESMIINYKGNTITKIFMNGRIEYEDGDADKYVIEYYRTGNKRLVQYQRDADKLREFNPFRGSVTAWKKHGLKKALTHFVEKTYEYGKPEPHPHHATKKGASDMVEALVIKINQAIVYADPQIKNLLKTTKAEIIKNKNNIEGGTFIFPHVHICNGKKV